MTPQALLSLWLLPSWVLANQYWLADVKRGVPTWDLRHRPQIQKLWYTV